MGFIFHAITVYIAITSDNSIGEWSKNILEIDLK